MQGGVKRDETGIEPVFIVKSDKPNTEILDYYSIRSKNDRILVSDTGIELYYCSWHSEPAGRCMTNKELTAAIGKSVDGLSKFSIWNCFGRCWDDCKVNNLSEDVKNDKLEARLRSVEKLITEKQIAIANMSKVHKVTRETRNTQNNELLLLINSINDLEHNYKNSPLNQDLKALEDRKEILTLEWDNRMAKALKMWENFSRGRNYISVEDEEDDKRDFLIKMPLLSSIKPELNAVNEKYNNLMKQGTMLKSKHDKELAALNEKVMRLKESLLSLDKTLAEDYKYPLYEIMEGLRIFTDLQKNELKEFLRKRNLFQTMNKTSPEYIFWEKYAPLRKEWTDEKREITKTIDDDEVERIYMEVKKEKESAAAEVKAIKEEGNKISAVVKGIKGKILVAGSKKVVNVGNMRQVTALPTAVKVEEVSLPTPSIREWRKEEEYYPESKERDIEDLREKEAEQEVNKQWRALDYSERYEREEAFRQKQSAYGSMSEGGGGRVKKAKYGGER